MGGFEDDFGSSAHEERLFPALDAQAPAVPFFKAWEVIFFDGGGEIVADLFGEGEELVGHDGADEVESEVIATVVAATIAKIAGHRVGTAELEFGSEDIFGFGARHEWLGSPREIGGLTVLGLISGDSVELESEAVMTKGGAAPADRLLIVEVVPNGR